MENIIENSETRGQWKSFWRLIKEANVPWYLYFLTLGMDILSAKLFVKLPVLLGDIMEGMIFNGNLIFDYSLISLANLVFSFLTILVFNIVDLKINISGTVGVWNKIIQLPMKRIISEGASSLTSRVTNDSTGLGLALSGIFNLFSTICSILLVYLEMLRVNKNLTLMLLVVPLWVVFSMKIIGRLAYGAQKNIQDNLSTLTSYLSIQLPNIKQIKSYGMETQEFVKGKAIIEEQYHSEIVMARVNIVCDFLTLMTNLLNNLIVLGYGTFLMSQQQLSLGAFTTFFVFVTQGNLDAGMSVILMYYQNIKNGLGCCSKIAEIMGTNPELLNVGEPLLGEELKQSLYFDSVSFAYNDKIILDDISFCIPKNKLTVIVGTNGSGKSTLLKLIERLYQPNSGNIYYGKENIQKYSLNEWRRQISYAIQNSPLMFGTIKENLMYGITDSDETELLSLTSSFGFDIKDSTKFLNTQVGEMGEHLSGGQKQKLSIIRSITKDANIYLFDEITDALDSTSDCKVLELLTEKLKNKTIVAVTHDINMVKAADYVVFLENGRCVETGKHEELLQQSKNYRSLWSY